MTAELGHRRTPSAASISHPSDDHVEHRAPYRQEGEADDAGRERAYVVTLIVVHLVTAEPQRNG